MHKILALKLARNSKNGQINTSFRKKEMDKATRCLFEKHKRVLVKIEGFDDG